VNLRRWSETKVLVADRVCWQNLLLIRHVRKTRICDCRIFSTLPHF